MTPSESERALPSLPEDRRCGPLLCAWRRSWQIPRLARTPKRRSVTSEDPRSRVHPPNAVGDARGVERLLFHPEEEPLVGEIFSVVVSAVLLGRLSAMRRDKQLIKLDPARKQDPATTTVQAVRCFHWASAILGMHSPALFADPDYEGFVEMVPASRRPRASARQALSGRSAAELAFLRGSPSRELPRRALREDARAVGARSRGHLPRRALDRQPGPPAQRAGQAARRADRQGDRADPRAGSGRSAPRPLPPLRRGGRAARISSDGRSRPIARWRARASSSRTISVRRTTSWCSKDKAHLDEKMDDLMSFVVSDRYAKLRKQIGIAIA